MMKKMLALLIFVAILFSLVACNNDARFTEGQNHTILSEDARFTEGQNRTILSEDGTEYTFVGFEGMVACLGEWKFIGHIKGEQETFYHLADSIKTGMYSVRGNEDVLIRYFPNNEFSGIYVRSELLNTEITLDRCIRFVLLKYSEFYNKDTVIPQKGVAECQQFLNEIKNGQTAEDAELYNLVKQPDGSYKNCYLYGYVCGVLQEDLNLVIPLTVWSFDDKAYSIVIDGVEYVLPEEWINKLIVE